MSQGPNLSNFLSGKPEISAVGQSALLSRLRTFLPQMEEANKNMPNGSTSDDFQIVEKDEEEESTSSESSSDSDCDMNVKEEKKRVKKLKKTEEKPNPAEKRIEIDLDVFEEKNSRVNEQDVSVQPVDSLPVAFQQKSGNSDEKMDKKPMIEEL